MKKIKYFIITLTLLGSLFFLFSPEVFPDNLQFKESLNLTPQNDVIIIFNSGGWGNTPLEEAEDFTPIIEGIQKTLKDLGYNSIVIPYKRTKDNFLGKISGIKGTVWAFRNQAESLSQEIEEFLKKNPSKKIIIAGLSNGAAFVDDTMGEISDNIKNQVLAVEVGVPFWKKTLNSDNVLYLNNEGKDPLVRGEMKTLFSTIFKAPFRWLLAKISGKNLAFSQAFYIPGHEYSWVKVKPAVVTFLENKLK